MIGAASTGLLLPVIARAQSPLVRVGFMLPYTGTYAQLGVAIENGVRMALDEVGGKLGGRDIEFFKVDDESNPAKGVENANRLVQRNKVDVLIGPVHSGVQMGIHKVARESGVLSLIPNAGVHAVTRQQCARNVFRTSFTNAQPTLALGKPMVERGHKQKLGLPFPNVEFQALLTEIAALKPDAVACFFAGGGAAKFLRDYAAAGLNRTIPLYGSGFLTEGVLEAAGGAAEGVITTLHYSDSLDTPRNKQFRLNLREDLQAPARRVRRAGVRHRPAAPAGGQGRRRRPFQQKGAVRGAGRRRHRQPARPVAHEQGAQPDPGHLPTPSQGQGKPRHRRRRQGAGRPGHGLPPGLNRRRVASRWTPRTF